ncbi:hypothetical protein DY000_02040574 [Brassica cretica]|uniref:Stress-response A/B barrel domain-containing protein n=1 Tax=Brassica cretica TaxID=69181 RepID=A0ABQ7BHE6_BRACR|nr:hypothetical protein DY000_02040574 [Brassica cretica]
MSQIIERIVLFKVKDDVDSDKIDAMVNGLNSLAAINQVFYLSAATDPRKISGRSVGKVTLLKEKENVTEEAKKEIMEVVNEKSSGTDGISVGENFTPARGKEVETHEESVKEKVGGYVEDTIVVEFLVPPPS